MHSLTGSRRNPRTIRPRVEGLESRWTPADLTAVVSNGVLSITAVAADAVEGLTVLSGAAPGTVDVAPDMGTTVNGQPATAHFPGVKSVRVSLRGGDDRVGVEELEIPGNLSIQSGNGANFVDIYRSRIAGNVTVTSGKNATTADDKVFIESYVWIGGKATINRAGGSGKVNVFNQVEIGGGLAITGGSGTDEVTLDDIRLTGMARFNLGGGDMNTTFAKRVFLAGSAAVTGSAANDYVIVADTTITGSLVADLGGGNNAVAVDYLANVGSSVGSRVSRNLSVQTGSGTDRVYLGGQQPVFVGGTMTIRTGDEGDTLVANDLTCLGAVDIDLGLGADTCGVDFDPGAAGTDVSRFGSSFKLQTGGGDDNVILGLMNEPKQKAMFARAPVLIGGGGDDTAYLQNYSVGETDAAPLTPSGFETVNK
jgi:hypothetical protein